MMLIDIIIIELDILYAVLVIIDICVRILCIETPASYDVSSCPVALQACAIPRYTGKPTAVLFVTSLRRFS
jgi:hypothetical protein